MAKHPDGCICETCWRGRRIAELEAENERLKLLLSKAYEGRSKLARWQREACAVLQTVDTHPCEEDAKRLLSEAEGVGDGP